MVKRFCRSLYYKLYILSLLELDFLIGKSKKFVIISAQTLIKHDSSTPTLQMFFSSIVKVTKLTKLV